MVLLWEDVGNTEIFFFGIFIETCCDFILKWLSIVFDRMDLTPRLRNRGNRLRRGRTGPRKSVVLRRWEANNTYSNLHFCKCFCFSPVLTLLFLTYVCRPRLVTPRRSEEVLKSQGAFWVFIPHHSFFYVPHFRFSLSHSFYFGLDYALSDREPCAKHFAEYILFLNSVPCFLWLVVQQLNLIRAVAAGWTFVIESVLRPTGNIIC